MKVFSVNISIALASYNGERYLQCQLDSLYEQSRRPDQVVIADDRSTDETLKIAQAFARRPGIEVTILANTSGVQLRPPRNFARAIAACTGDVVFCCDQDDAWDRAKIATAVDRLASRPDLACFMNDTWICDQDLAPTGLSKQGQLRVAGLPEDSFVMGCCAAFTRRFLDFAMPIPGEITHDNWLVSLSDLLGLTERSGEVLQRYRIHSANVSKHFYVNRATGMNPLGLAMARLKGMASKWSSNEALMRELLFVTEAETRLSGRKVEIEAAYPAADVANALKTLSIRRQRLSRRQSIRQSRGAARAKLLLSALRRGEYRGLNGLLDAVKDALVSMDPSATFILWRH